IGMRSYATWQGNCIRIEKVETVRGKLSRTRS
ncbi:hypothetical protein CFOL_v3_28809, partial [Cephalotus follicularis]